MFIRLCMQLITFTFYEDFQKHSLNFLLFRQLKVQLTRVEGFYKKWIWPRPSHSTPKACCYIYRLFCCYCAGKNSIPNHLFQIWWPTGCLAGQIWKLHFQDRLYHPMLVERDWMASFKNLTCIWSNSLRLKNAFPFGSDSIFSATICGFIFFTLIINSSRNPWNFK